MFKQVSSLNVCSSKTTETNVHRQEQSIMPVKGSHWKDCVPALLYGCTPQLETRASEKASYELASPFKVCLNFVQWK